MSQLSRYTSQFLLIVFGYILTPAALIHEFQGHEDTSCMPGTTASIETKHLHCKLLQIEAQVYTSPPPVILASIPELFAPSSIPQHQGPSKASVIFSDLRGPPVV
jgi:hypothetical protein